MSDSYIAVGADGAGKKVQTYKNMVAGIEVHAEAFVIVDSSGVPVAIATEATLASIDGNLVYCDTDNVTVISSDGLKAADLSIEAVSKHLEVDVKNGIAVTQADPALLKATVTQASIARTVTGTVTAEQATRTSLLNKPEREDLLLKDVDFATNGAVQAYLAAVGSQKHKVFAYGYEADADGVYYFSATVNGSAFKFGRRITKGLIAQTFVHPIVCDVNTALNFMCTTGNAKTWIQYKTEA